MVRGGIPFFFFDTLFDKKGDSIVLSQRHTWTRFVKLVSFCVFTCLLLVLSLSAHPAIASPTAPAVTYTGPTLRLPWLNGSFPISGNSYGCGDHTTGTKDAYAIDFGLPAGTPVTAVFAGTVWVGQPDPNGYGNNLWVTNGSWRAVYAHLQDNSYQVLPGQQVFPGQILALSGYTGNVSPSGSRGAHLHFSLRSGGTGRYDGDPVIPEPMSGYSDFSHWGLTQDNGCNYAANNYAHQYNPEPGGWWIGPTPSDFTVISSGSTVPVNFRMNDNLNNGLNHGDITYWSSSSNKWQVVPASSVKTTSYNNGTADVYTELSMPNAYFEVSVNVYANNDSYQLAPSGIRHFCTSSPCNASKFPSGGNGNTGGTGNGGSPASAIVACTTTSFNGTCDTFNPGATNDLSVYGFSSSINSVRVPIGSAVTLYDAINLGGQSATFTSDVSDLSTVGWSNRAKSLTVATSFSTAIYDETLASGWQDWSWNSTRNFSNTTAPNTGSNDISWTVTSGYGGLYLHKIGGINTSKYTTLTFALEATQSGPSLQVELFDSSDTAIGTPLPLTNYGGNPTTGSYKTYSIPLADLGGSNRTINGLAIQDNTGSAQPAVLVDTIALQGYATPVSVYDESLSSGWLDYSWDSTRNFSDTTAPYTGTKDIAWTITAAWGGLYLHKTGGIDTTGLTYLIFALQATQSGQSVKVMLYDSTDTIINGPILLTNYGGDPVSGSDTLYAISLGDLGGTNQIIDGVAIMDATGSVQPAMYVDAISFS
jgi:hypothetical protein